MPILPPRSRVVWAVCLACIISLGILSRLTHTGFVLFDKYLGDALYAAMVYAILRHFAGTATAGTLAIVAMTAIEILQLTLIPAHMLSSDHLIVRIAARLLGTSFSLLDLLAYAIGIAAIWLADGWSQPRSPRSLQ